MTEPIRDTPSQVTDDISRNLNDILSLKSDLTCLNEIDSNLINVINWLSNHLVSDLIDKDLFHQSISNLINSKFFINYNQRIINLLIIILSDPSTSISIILIISQTLLLFGFQNSHFFKSLHSIILSNHAINSNLASNPTQSSPINLINLIIEIIHRTKIFSNYLSINSPLDLSISISSSSSINEKHAEKNLGSTLTGLLYELCRVQKLDPQLLVLFTPQLINNLFQLVELTRDQEDETFNYNLIKLIIALNEQFMVAGLHHQHHTIQSNSTSNHHHKTILNFESNIVIKTMKDRLDESKTFGENLIFILNRASNSTPEGRCVSLLILKILYLLFITPGTHEYFYTNDLCVLVDVFIRALSDLPEESQDLRHTYLRVLHPLLTKTQLRNYSYKRQDIRQVLLSHLQFAHLHDINSTTRRLVSRNLQADWCQELEKQLENSNDSSFGSSNSKLALLVNSNNITTQTNDTDNFTKITSSDFKNPSISDINLSTIYLDSPILSLPSTNSSGTSSPTCLEPPSTESSSMVTNPRSLINSSASNDRFLSSAAYRLPSSTFSNRSISPMSDIPQRPESSCSASHSPARRPAPKPPIVKRNHQLSSHQTTFSNEPHISNTTHYQIADSHSNILNTQHVDSLKSQGQLSKGESTTQVSTDPPRRRTAPSPPVPIALSFPNEEILPRRRKAPLPPSQPIHKLRGTKSSIHLGLRDEQDEQDETINRTNDLRGRKLGHARVVSLSNNLSNNGADPFKDFSDD
ncbi:hypothetical protein O181_049499 [Austropuccinia psidii MF-1]|uniref:SPIN90/Ldb17 leucine-rich domain-containing protein n=1 Tax=Austropuccinia psidii MF-1 TaxID=1389203 RepID=A0A9Q3HNU3_9BASI|nr:hypothetical protein [Austropuccinia psidii MF-1]